MQHKQLLIQERKKIFKRFNQKFVKFLDEYYAIKKNIKFEEVTNHRKQVLREYDEEIEKSNNNVKKLEWYEDFQRNDLKWMVNEFIKDQIWDFGFKVRKLYPNEGRTELIPTYCPYHTKYTANESLETFEKLYKEQCIKCETKNVCFKTADGLKRHCLKINDWYHRFLYLLIKVLYEEEPNPIGPTTFVFNGKQSDKKQNSTMTKFQVQRCVKK